MASKLRPVRMGRYLVILGAIALLSACMPPGVSTPPSGGTSAATGEPTASTPPATASSGGSVVPVINF